MKNDVLYELMKRSEEININDGSKIIIMSDLHRSDGSNSDNFFKNRTIYHAALSYYCREGFTYIELGDSDELWENRVFQNIVETYGDIFEILRTMHKEKRYIQLFGNHDMIKKDLIWRVENLYSHKKIHGANKQELFRNIKIPEGLVLDYKGDKILLTHGHQVEFSNYKLWRVNAFLVRNLWRRLELIGILNPFDTNSDQNKYKKTENKFIKWTKKHKCALIAGHTHRTIFPDYGKDHFYFNDGCCVYKDHITGIEISNGKISLVKWSIKIGGNGSLYAGKDFVHPSLSLDKLFDGE